MEYTVFASISEKGEDAGHPYAGLGHPGDDL